MLRVGEDAHPQILAMLAGQLEVHPAAFSDYLHGRDTTRREHVLELLRDFGFRSFSATIYRELASWLLPIAVTTDVGTVLVGSLIDEMRERRVLAPALSTIERLAWEDASAGRAARIRSVDRRSHGCAASAIGRSARGAARRSNDDAGDVAPAATETDTGHIHGVG